MSISNYKLHLDQTKPQRLGDKVKHDEIASIAFSLYEKHGSEHGHDVPNWLQAEVQFAKLQHKVRKLPALVLKAPTLK